jgi:hypothetical protein
MKTDEGDARAELAALRARCERLYATSALGKIREIARMAADLVMFADQITHACNQFERWTHEQSWRDGFRACR